MIGLAWTMYLQESNAYLAPNPGGGATGSGNPETDWCAGNTHYTRFRG